MAEELIRRVGRLEFLAPLERVQRDFEDRWHGSPSARGIADVQCLLAAENFTRAGKSRIAQGHRTICRHVIPRPEYCGLLHVFDTQADCWIAQDHVVASVIACDPLGGKRGLADAGVRAVAQRVA